MEKAKKTGKSKKTAELLKSSAVFSDQVSNTMNSTILALPTFALSVV